MTASKYRGTSIYDNEYYTGAQTAVYIGDVQVDEVVTINYGQNESRQPVYGYASREFDAMTNGTRIVQGTFAINFKEAGYLYVILQRYKDLMSSSNQLGPLASASAKSSAHSILRANIERFLELPGHKPPIGSVNTPDGSYKSLAPQNVPYPFNGDVALNEFANGVAGLLSGERLEGDGPVRAFDSAAENLFEEYENAIWGPRGLNKDGEHPGVINYGDKAPEFQQARGSTDPHWGGFNIFMTYGDYDENDWKNHTVEKIVDVHLLGSQKDISPGPGNVLEVYSFVGKKIV